MLRVTKGQVEEFKSSMIWADIRKELGMWIKALKDDALSMALQCASEDIPLDVTARLAAIGGRLEAIHHILQIPDQFLDLLKEQANAGRNEAD